MDKQSGSISDYQSATHNSSDRNVASRDADRYRRCSLTGTVVIPEVAVDGSIAAQTTLMTPSASNSRQRNPDELKF